MNTINNLSVKSKLRVLVSIMLVFTLLIASIGIFGLIQANNLDGQLYEEQTKPLATVSNIIQNLLSASSSFDMAILSSDDLESVENYRKKVEELNNKTIALISEYNNMKTSSETSNYFNDSTKIFNEIFLPNSPKVFELLEKGDVDGADAIMGGIDIKIDEMIQGFDKIQEINIENSANKRMENKLLTRNIIFFLIGIFVFGFIIVVFVSMRISFSISKPMKLLADFVKDVSITGNLNIDDKFNKDLDVIKKRNDEFGQATLAFLDMFEMLIEKSVQLDLIATGDLSRDIKLKSEHDVLGNSILSMQKQLSDLFVDIIGSAEQVSGISEQIANSSQNLAMGASDQSESIEQLANNISIITNQSNENASMASNAAQLEKSIIINAQEGSEKMEKMIVAVKDINDASLSIQKVIKVIDDIAFQTNILALNAAVEAARASQHGKGFAVVADEVRNLAAKSGEAAKETSLLIENTIQKADLGVQIADETSVSLEKIISGIKESNETVSEIAKSNEEQSNSTSEINKQIEQIDLVVQQNSATAQQSAAASQEMNSQAVTLHDLVSKFKTQ